MFLSRNVNKWESLIHNGVLFPDPYKPHNIPIIYNGKKVVLDNKLAEEYATLYAKYTDTEYIQNKTFNKNFWKDWKKILGKDHIIKELDRCDFSKIYEHIIELKSKKKELTDKEKEKKKELENMYKLAYVDHTEQLVGNFRIEPPGIYIGRGCNPQLGRIKRRIYPEDITLNLGKEAPIPKLPHFYSQRKWGKIIHDRTLIWLASWKDEIQNKTKYVWLSAGSDIQSHNDIEKFELARKLKKKIKSIRKKNEKILNSKDLKKKQIGTALYFIDNLALRVGNEKSADIADTVGVTNLRIEHIQLLENNTIKLNFLGKDSIKYVNKVQVLPIIYSNLEEFIKSKDKKDQLFNLISSIDINKYLQSLMKNLTAKVFRTYNASNNFQKEINNIFIKYEKNKNINLKDEYNKANTKIAALCNHQKKVSKNYNKQIENIDKKIKELKKTNKKNKDEKMKILKTKKKMKMEQKNLSLGTSKANYIDPRIRVAFVKKFDLNINIFFTKTELTKFKWALETDKDFNF